MSGSHAGRRAAVYGASSGMGRATALALARAGADVAVLARSVDALEQVASEIRDAGRHGVAIPVDVQDAAAARASVGSILDALGGLDILVYCDGLEHPGSCAGAAESLGLGADAAHQPVGAV